MKNIPQVGNENSAIQEVKATMKIPRINECLSIIRRFYFILSG
ncbi:hypothetical protein J2S00_001221 [Caldalkalibacillus uzonensis]|uniref:Uncharacterized protein n=1 Tax=Caldalkalibacillus uzonensis TaxID=353224 RepID=A0ABU0CPU0_9BACI|nr:hypothetical protein [Caldalkalibacillus uzonensis]